MNIVATIARTPHAERVAKANQHEAELEKLKPKELAEVGRLLCHASDTESRKNYPIIGDYRPNEQQKFETSLFGDGFEKPGSYATLDVLRPDSGAV